MWWFCYYEYCIQKKCPQTADLSVWSFPLIFYQKMNFGYVIYQFIYHVSSQRDVKHLHQKFCEQSSATLLFFNNILARTCQGLGPDNLNSPMHLPLYRIHSIGSVDEIMHFKHIKCRHEGTQHTPGSPVWGTWPVLQ